MPCFTHETVETTRWRMWIGFESDDYEEGCSVGRLSTVSVKLSLFLEYTPLQNFNYVCFKTPVSVTWGAGIDVCHFIRPSTPHDACARSARVYLLFNARTSQGCLFRCITSHTSKLSFFMHKHRYKQTQQVLPHVHVSFLRLWWRRHCRPRFSSYFQYGLFFSFIRPFKRKPHDAHLQYSGPFHCMATKCWTLIFSRSMGTKYDNLL